MIAKMIAKMVARLLIPLFALLALGLPANAQSPVDITADNFVLNELTREAVFTGNVEVVHPTVTVFAPTVTIVYGEEGTSEIESFIATGNVRLVSPGQVATGERAVFDPVANTLHLTGNVVVESDSGTVRGPELLVDLTTSVSTFTGTSGSRVTGSFTTQ